MHSINVKQHMRLMGILCAVTFAGTSAFAMNVATPVATFQPTTGTTYNAAACQPIQHNYRTVTIDTAANGTVNQTIHHPGYYINSNGAVTPEFNHGHYRVVENGQVVPQDNNNCQDGTCQLPGKANQ